MEFVKTFFKFVFGIFVLCFLAGLYIGVEYGKAGDYYFLQKHLADLNITKSQVQEINKDIFPSIESNMIYTHLYKDSNKSK